MKTIVIRLSYDTLFEQIKNSSEDWRLKDYNLYTNLDLDYTLKHNFEFASMNLRHNLKVLKDYYIDDKAITICDSLDRGNDIDHKESGDLDLSGKLAAKKHTAISWYLLDQNIERLIEIVEWCYNRKIEVLLITP